LGFGAIQLAHAGPDSEMTLERLVQEGWLTRPPDLPLQVPGDAQTQEALGYLHANCAHCHNQRRPPEPGLRCYNPRKDFDLSLRTNQLAAVADTPVYRTAVGKVIVPGNPDTSLLIRRLRESTSFHPRMPPLGTKDLDTRGITTLAAWISAMAADPSRRPE
jgi:hypothetical protein